MDDGNSTVGAAPAASAISVAAALRDPALRRHYAALAMAHVPRLLGAIDRNPYHATYGCLDRQYWHYRTASFPSAMYQEGALPLALLYTQAMPGNVWRGAPRMRELAEAALRFTANSGHADGSCDDYYPYERALGAAVFSLQAAARAYELLELDDAQIVTGLARRALWIAANDESGRLANHHALAALGLARMAAITGDERFQQAARGRLKRLLAWQSSEGWFEEYGGADPGYQTLTIDCLAKLRGMWNAAWLDEPLRRAVEFSRHFLHPDDSYSGHYGSRGAMHFYPHGMERLSAHLPAAADLADGYLRSLSGGTSAALDDDRMILHRLGNMMEAYADWSPVRAAPLVPPPHYARRDARGASIRYFRDAGMLVCRAGGWHTVASAARGGMFRHFAAGHSAAGDAGLIVQTQDGRVAVSQTHDLSRDVQFYELRDSQGRPFIELHVSGPLHWARHETATPLKQALLHLGMLSVGRWCRDGVRRILQRRLITGRRPCPVKFRRVLQVRSGQGDPSPYTLHVTDTIELLDRSVNLRRMHYGTDHQAAYVAATGVWQQGDLACWSDLTEHVDQLNARRRVTISRSW